MMYKLLRFAGALFIWASCHSPQQDARKSPKREAGPAFTYWNMGRLYPDGILHTEKLVAEIEKLHKITASRGGPNAVWTDIGPKNIGGRTLSLAFHPQDPEILFMGSASGGLWKSTTGGKGVNAWQRVETGFPVIGVGAIAIDPLDPNIMYIGTGEVYNYENSAPNVVERTTRGTYGIGILKSVDGGNMWQKSLNVNYQDLTGVQEIKINPMRPQTVWATTTYGLIRSYDAGATWQTVLQGKMAVDLDMHPSDTSTLFVTFGSLDDNATSGIFRTTDGGTTFNKLANGIPSQYSGKAMLDICRSNPEIIYASVGDAFAQIGLFKSSNGGTNWQAVSTEDVCKYQGWYSHDVAVQPTNPEKLFWSGIDMWQSSTGGASVYQTTFWYNWDFGQVPVGGPEGPGDYVHADIHRLFFHPTNPNATYCVTDGGLFVSEDSGANWEGRNGGYQTQQFYANMSNSPTNPAWAIGGMQDNSTAIYTGDPAWIRVLGGDGACTAINPFVDDIMYASSQNGNFYQTGNGGATWSPFQEPLPGFISAFVAPFEIAPSNPDWAYAGKDILCRMDFNTQTWEELSSVGGVLVTIAVSPNNAEDVMFSRAAKNNIPPRVFRINAGTQEVTEFSGLPDRTCMDIARHPQSDDIAFAVVSGFGTDHLWRTQDGGATWVAIQGLPDVPHNSVLIDPAFTNHIYVANDIGVWFSPDEGTTWEYLDGGPQAMLAMHLSISADRKLRVATHGLGVWQTPMQYVISTQQVASVSNLLRVNPNPAQDYIQVNWKGADWNADLTITDLRGRIVQQAGRVTLSRQQSHLVNLANLPNGIYLLSARDQSGRQTAVRKFVITH